MTMSDRPLPYTLLLPLAELEHIIHGGGAGTVEAELVFEATDDYPHAHPDVPAKVVLGFRKMNTRLVAKIVGAVLTPEQAAEKAEHEQWLAEREAQGTSLRS